MENQPMRLGQLFSFSFKLLGKDFWKMFLTALIGIVIIAIPVVVCFIGLIPEFSNFNTTSLYRNFFINAQTTNLIAASIVIIIVSLAVVTFIQGIILNMASSRFQGKPLLFKEAFHLTAEKYGRLILTALSNFVLLLPLIAVYVAVYVGFFSQIYTGHMAAVQSIIYTFGLLLMNLIYYAAVIYLGLVIDYSWCITINEDAYGFRALGRAFSLMARSGFWKNIGNYVLMLLAISGAAFAFYFVCGLLAALGMFAILIFAFIVVIFVLIYFAFIAAVYPYRYIYTQLMYFNARILTEGKPF